MITQRIPKYHLVNTIKISFYNNGSAVKINSREEGSFSNTENINQYWQGFMYNTIKIIFFNFCCHLVKSSVFVLDSVSWFQLYQAVAGRIQICMKKVKSISQWSGTFSIIIARDSVINYPKKLDDCKLVHYFDSIRRTTIFFDKKIVMIWNVKKSQILWKKLSWKSLYQRFTALDTSLRYCRQLL